MSLSWPGKFWKRDVFKMAMEKFWFLVVEYSKICKKSVGTTEL